MRDRGEEPPAEISAKLRELFQSGALQRPAGGGQAPGGAAGAGARPRAAQPSSRTVYLMPANTLPNRNETWPRLQPLKVKIGISDGAYTEVTDGLKEGDVVVIERRRAETRPHFPEQMARFS